MLDVRYIVSNAEKFKASMEKRGCFDQQQLINLMRLFEEVKHLELELQDLQRQRNESSNMVKNALAQTQRQELITKSQEISSRIEAFKVNAEEKRAELDSIMVQIPNLLQDSVPFGKTEEQNEQLSIYNPDIVFSNHTLEMSEVKTHIINSKSKPMLDHIDILKSMDFIDIEKTVEMSGSRFVTLKKDACKLERALASLMLDINIKNEFTEMSPPYMIKESAMFKAGHLPKFAEDSFLTTTNHRLIPTAEVCLANLYADTILSQDELPIRVTAHTPCFRSEAGSAGRDTKGMIRLHQFSKVELLTICTPQDAEYEHQYILNTAKSILELLKLPYRVMLLCSGDTSDLSSKTYDIEVWFPSQKKYREISSCSNYLDYQSRRLKTRYKPKTIIDSDSDETINESVKLKDSKPLKQTSSTNILTNTLNGSSLPIGRTLAAIVENYMDYDNDCIRVPEVLMKYMGGQSFMKK